MRNTVTKENMPWTTSTYLWLHSFTHGNKTGYIDMKEYWLSPKYFGKFYISKLKA